MCKLAIISGITDETKENAWKFIKEMSKEMSKPNSPEEDGFGYAAIDNEGNLFGEKWLNNADAFQHKNVYGNEADSVWLKKYRILTKEKVYTSFGKVNDNIRSITLHSRAATTPKGIKNTHPFVKKHTSVIHNGMIGNHGELHKEMSSCDSEAVLHQYIKFDVANKPNKFQKVASKLEGYYALGIFSKTNKGEPILDIVKDDTAKLNAYFINELNTFVYATPKFYSSPVEATCKTLGFTIASEYVIRDNKLQRLNALTGEPIAFESFQSKKFTKTYNSNLPVQSDHKNTTMYPYGDERNHAYEQWEKIFNRGKPTKESNVIDMTNRTSHSTEKHNELVKERVLEDILMNGINQYTKEDVNKLLSETIIDENDNSDIDWWMDDQLVWHKKDTTT